MKILTSILCAALLAGCSTIPPLDKSIAIGRPSKFNADPDRYDHKIVISVPIWQRHRIDGSSSSMEENIKMMIKNA